MPSNFTDLEKLWKIERNSGEMVKSLKFFFQCDNKCFLSDFYFFRFGQILFNLARTFAMRTREKLRVEIVETSLRKQLTYRDATTQWFPREMTSEEGTQKFHTDDVSLLTSWWCV